MADKLCATGVRYTSPSFDYLRDFNDPFGRMNPGIVSQIIDRMQGFDVFVVQMSEESR